MAPDEQTGRSRSSDVSFGAAVVRSRSRSVDALSLARVGEAVGELSAGGNMMSENLYRDDRDGWW